VYFSYPFVLSWSLVEAMSAGCVVIGSDTAPVREILSDQNGIRVPFFDVDQLAHRTVEVLSHRSRFLGMRTAARQTILDKYDLTRTCLPALVDYVCGDITSKRSGRMPSGRLPDRREGSAIF